MTRAFIASTFVSLFVVACAAEDTDAIARRGKATGSGDESAAAAGEENADGTTPGADPTQPGSCTVGAPHPGFAGTDFVADRKPGAIAEDRRRVKPFSALRTEFQRVLGQIPAAMAQSASAYGDVPARWYSEPTAGAISLNTTYSLAFTGCYDTMTATNYSVMPTAETAQTECAQMQRKFWQRTATPEETQACVDFVMSLTAETVARRKWAHACASVMSSAGFTTY